MAKVAYAVVSSNILLNNRQEIVVENPFHTIILNNLPNHYTFNLSFSIIEIEHNAHHIVKINIIHEESGKIISDAIMEFDTEPSPLDDNEILGTMSQNVEIRNQLFEDYGTYKIEFDVNGNIHSIYFMVTQK